MREVPGDALVRVFEVVEGLFGHVAADGTGQRQEVAFSMARSAG